MNIAHFNLGSSYSDTGLYEHKTTSSPLISLVESCHNALLSCPNVLNHLAHKRDIDLHTICENRIGFFDVALPLCIDTHPDAQTIDYHSYEELRGCVTVPLVIDGEVVGIQGELFNNNVDDLPHNHLLNLNEVLEPIKFSKSVLRCVSQLDVLALQHHGYQNSFCDVSGNLSELTLQQLHSTGAEVMVYFTDCYGADFDVNRAEELSEYYNIRLCEVNLPFALSNFGLWDTYQWQLFDKRLSAALKSCNAYNERYQA